MAIRKFYLESYIDGRKTPLTGGPRSKDGGMKTFISIRDKGEIESAVRIDCSTYEKDGKEMLKIQLDIVGVKDPIIITRER